MDPSSIKLLKDHKNLVLLMAKSNKSSSTRVPALFRESDDVAVVSFPVTVKAGSLVK